MNIMDILSSQLSGDSLGKLGAALGTDETKTKAAVGAGLPAILGGLAGLASSGDGASKLSSMLGRLDPSALGGAGGLGSMLGGKSGATLDQGNNALGSLFGGGALDGIAGAVSKFTGMDGATVKKLLAYLAPLVLGTIAKQFQGKAVTPQALSGFFAEQKSNIAGAMPGGFSLGNIPGLGSLTSAASSATGAAKSAADSAVRGAGRAADAAAATGSSAARWLLPLILILAIIAAVWYFLGRGTPTPTPTPTPATTAPSPANAPALGTLGDATQVGRDLTAIATSATDALTGIKDAATANAALPKLRELNTRLGDVTKLWDTLPETGRASVRSAAGAALTSVKGLVAKAAAVPGVGPDVKPVLDEMTKKLAALGA